MFGDDASSPSADSVAEVNGPAESDSNIDNVSSLLAFGQVNSLLCITAKVGFPCVLGLSCPVLKVVQ